MFIPLHRINNQPTNINTLHLTHYLQTSQNIFSYFVYMKALILNTLARLPDSLGHDFVLFLTKHSPWNFVLDKTLPQLVHGLSKPNLKKVVSSQLWELAINRLTKAQFRLTRDKSSLLVYWLAWIAFCLPYLWLTLIIDNETQYISLKISWG